MVADMALAQICHTDHFEETDHDYRPNSDRNSKSPGRPGRGLAVGHGHFNFPKLRNRYLSDYIHTAGVVGSNGNPCSRARITNGKGLVSF
jgi:hypothetical protein